MSKRAANIEARVSKKVAINERLANARARRAILKAEGGKEVSACFNLLNYA